MDSTSPPREQEGTATTTSPTGTPKVAPQAVPWLLAILVGLGAAAGACALTAKDEVVRNACLVADATIGSILGVISPGLRRKDGGQ